MDFLKIKIRPVCVMCSCEMSCEKNGAYVYLKGSHLYISGDLYKCPKCGNIIVSGFAQAAFRFSKHPGLVVAEINL